MTSEDTLTDFFISYAGEDSQWAEWIALELEKAGYQTIIQAWDLRPGSNFLAEMDEARDSIRFYFLGADGRRRIEHAGNRKPVDLDGALIF